ncbi:MAG TPA: hypothetical protein PLV25_02075 [Opitutales bacterium]|nr:hypothetical protein [Opitutales bacterium]
MLYCCLCCVLGHAQAGSGALGMLGLRGVGGGFEPGDDEDAQRSDLRNVFDESDIAALFVNGTHQDTFVPMHGQPEHGLPLGHFLRDPEGGIGDVPYGQAVDLETFLLEAPVEVRNRVERIFRYPRMRSNHRARSGFPGSFREMLYVQGRMHGSLLLALGGAPERTVSLEACADNFLLGRARDVGRLFPERVRDLLWALLAEALRRCSSSGLRPR